MSKNSVVSSQFGPTATENTPGQMATDISVVTPLFNEEDNVQRLISVLAASLERTADVGDYEIVCVDDGSTDTTLEQLRKYATSKTTVVSLAMNSGQSAALAAGIDGAKFETLGLIDGDLQTTPDDFEKLLTTLNEGYDLVNGVRVDRKDTSAKRFSSRIANSFRRWVLGDSFSDIGCPLKVFRKECVERMTLFDSFHRYLPHLVEIQGFRVTEVPVRHFPRVAGKTKYGVFDRLWIGLQSLLVVRWLGRTHIRRETKTVDRS
jgi:dolichol-phosphate mannosyltransferase